MKKRRHVLVTGGAGFIGSHLAERLLKKNYRVSVFDNLSTGLKGNVPQKAKFVLGDVAKPSDLKKVFQDQFSAVFHIAGCASTINSFTHPLGDVKSNFIGTVNVVRKCLEEKVPRFLYASSMTVYGRPEKLPISEEAPPRPISYYGISKYAAERFVQATAERVDIRSLFQATSFRMFNVYGERQSLTNPYQGVMAIFIGNVLRNEPITIFGDGKQSRDFVYIDDVVDAWIKSLDNKNAYNQVFNLGFGQDLSINELASTIIQVLGYDPKNYPIVYKPTRPGDQRYIYSDISKIKRQLRWKPKFNLKKGLRKTIKWASLT